ncbi:hypothetical protein MDMS009_716 [Methylophaga thiooxydans DMS010]|uniref:Uncharacterized protein n=1 Tax=Methylophaga thiooxydans DMS010 TaxID=637616 RepID=C0N3H9_9GAMM|nr:hypothetical protein MDMS009_716 [Methylophaga thiooxydans DMS010]
MFAERAGAVSPIVDLPLPATEAAIANKTAMFLSSAWRYGKP